MHFFSLVLLFCVVHGAPSPNNIINIRVSNGKNHTNKLNLLLKLQRSLETSGETNLEVDLQQNSETCGNNETRQIARIPQEDITTVEDGTTTELPATTQVYHEGYRHFPGYGWYKLLEYSSDWAGARRYCQQDGAELMIPDTDQEMEVVFRQMNPEGYYVSMGVHDPGRNGTWVTVYGDPVPQSWWAPGEPNSDWKYCGRAHNNGRLIVADCSGYRYVMCEIPE